MLRIFSARESVDKEKFIYEKIKGEAIVIVPDQYTLIAEEQALLYTGKDCIFDIEITGFRRLGENLLREHGEEQVEMLDKYGRFILLSGIIRREADELGIFKNVARKKTFVDMVNEFISNLKQQDKDSSDIEELLASGQAGEILSEKLRVLKKIADEYEKAMEGRLTDNEDFIAMYTAAIPKSRNISGKDIWVYGYDSYTPKTRKALIELAKMTSVSVVLTESDYGLDRLVTERLYEEAKEADVELSSEKIPQNYLLEKSETVSRLERYLFSKDQKEAIAANEDFKAEDLSLYACANQYFEAENAACYIHHLIRDEGYRMKDIAIIANDEEVMWPKISRIFDEYGLPLFVDSRRGISDTPVVSLVTALLEFVNRKYQTSYMLSILKSGFTGFELSDIWELENYARNFKIKGSMWDRKFKYGSSKYDEEVFAKLEAMREEVMEKVHKLEGLIKDGDSIRAFVDAYVSYLDEEWGVSDYIEEMTSSIEAGEGGDNNIVIEGKERIVGSYDSVISIMGQIAELLGEDDMDLSEFITMMNEGVVNTDVGMIPQTLDGISLGTMTRSRPAPVRAVMILGANEGKLPLEPSEEGLFTVNEKTFFAEKDFPLGTLDDLKLMEERVSMYRMISKAKEKVYISYSMSSDSGDETRPSILIEQLRALLPKLTAEKDVVSSGFGIDLVNNRREALRHLLEYIKEGRDKDDSEDKLAAALYSWYENEEAKMISPLLRAGLSENGAAPIGAAMSNRLYARGRDSYRLSASALESYDTCPFKFFVQRGLRPNEDREFSSDPRAIGDIYHDCLMRVSEKLTNGASPEVHLDEEEIERVVNEELAKIAEEYNEGLFESSEREKYRMSRIKTVCLEAARSLISQIESGEIDRLYYEEKFDSTKDAVFPPIEMDVDGRKVKIVGKIDRVDMLAGDNVRIIDYKTGSTSFDLDKVRAGAQIQLMVYLDAVLSEATRPAGVFYFKISDTDEKMGEKTYSAGKSLETDANEKLVSRFHLNGVYIDEEEIRKILPLEIVKTGDSKKLSREEFEELAAGVRESVRELSESIVKGDIRIRATRFGRGTSCDNCDYHAICRFDPAFKDNYYHAPIKKTKSRGAAKNTKVEERE